MTAIQQTIYSAALFLALCSLLMWTRKRETRNARNPQA